MIGISTLIEQGRQPDLIDEVRNLPDGVEALTYVGYLDNGDTSKALIKEIRKVEDVTTIRFPNGRTLFNKDWNDRGNVNYSFRK